MFRGQTSPAPACCLPRFLPPLPSHRTHSGGCQTAQGLAGMGSGSSLPLFAVPYTPVLLLLEMGHWVHWAFVQSSPAQYET